jgi:hypothetical protein
VFDAITTDGGTPVLRDGWIDLTGVSGSITIGLEGFGFVEFERLVLMP